MKENYLKKELYALLNNDPTIFEFIQSGSLDGIWYWDLENPEMEWMSPKFWETLGYNPKDKKHLASEWQGIVFQEDLVLAIENFGKHCVNPNHPYDQIVRYIHKNGSTVWIRCRGLAIRDQDGKAIRMLGAHTDITNFKKAELEFFRLSQEYEKVFNGTQDALLLIKVLGNGEFSYVRSNESHQSKTGIPLEELCNKTPQELLGKDLGDIVAENYKKCAESGESISYEEELKLPGGEYLWLTTLTPILEKNQVTHIVGSATDITKRKKLELELEKYANYDKLTGLPNRRLFFERLDLTIKENQRDRTKFALLFIDLDGFKEINDQHGHDIGDKVLIEVGNRLLGRLRKSDTVARMGGDEFTMIIRHVENKKTIHEFVTNILEQLLEVIHIGSITCDISCSIGVALYPDNGKDGETLLRNADKSMYLMKKNGKGGIRFSKTSS